MYLDEFKSIEDIAEKYSSYADEDEKQQIINLLNNSRVLLAGYECGSYSGSSFVLYEHQGKLYEVNGSHCSCYGLEGQWEPEETSWAALKMRKFDCYYGEKDEATKELQRLCKEHEDKQMMTIRTNELLKDINDVLIDVRDELIGIRRQNEVTLNILLKNDRRRDLEFEFSDEMDELKAAYRKRLAE